MNLIKTSLVFLLFYSSLCGATDVNKGLDFLNLSVGIAKDYKLPKEYRKQKLSFEGNYKKFSRIVFFKKKNKIRFKPFKDGLGVMLIKSRNNEILKRLTIDTKAADFHIIVREVNSLLSTIDGIDIKVLSRKVVIDGQIFLPRDMDRIQAVVQQYNPRVISLVVFSPDAQNQIARLIQKEIANPAISVKVTNNKFILEGQVATQKEKERAELIANLYTEYDSGEGAGVASQALKKKEFRRVTNLIQVNAQKPAEEKTKLIQVTAHYVGLKKDYNKGFLFQWTPIINDNTNLTYQRGVASGLTSTITTTIGNFFPKLNWAKSFGFARVLHNTNIMVEDTKTGTINVTTNIPVTTIGADGNVTTTTAPVTLQTRVTPTIRGAKKQTVSMALALAISNVAGRSNTGAIITSRSINTTLHVLSGQSAVVGGLVSSAIIKDFNRLPQGSGGTPLINLVSGKNYDSNQSQFVVFITPKIRSSASIGVERVKRRFHVDQE